MVQPGRKYQAGTASYRYSINGQEKDTELNENITTALYWEYDSRIGRRWNSDPIYKNSPYECFANNPIWYIDPIGLDTVKDWKNASVGDDFSWDGKTYYQLTRTKDDLVWAKTMSEVIIPSSKKSVISEKKESLADKIDKVKQKVDFTNSALNQISKQGSMMYRITEIADKPLTAYDMGKGMHSLVSTRNPSDGNFWEGIPLVGGVFGVSWKMTDDLERVVVEGALKNGYVSTIGMLNSSAGRRSGLIAVWATEDVLRSIWDKKEFILGEYKQGIQIEYPDQSNWYYPSPKNMNGSTYQYLLVFPRGAEGRIKEFSAYKVEMK